MEECYSFYSDRYKDTDEGRDVPLAAPLIKKPKKDVLYGQTKVSPTGRYISYMSNELGKYKFYLYDTQKEKRKKIAKGGYKLDEKVDHSFPLVAWHPTGKLMAYIVERKGFINLFYYNMETRKKDKLILYNFEKITDFSYSPDGSSFVFSAVQKGQSDIYVYHIASNSIDRLTNDIYNDLSPRFVNYSDQIIFSSNRPNDTLMIPTNTDNLIINENNDIFLYDYKGRSNVLSRITNTPVTDEIQPMEYEDGYFTFLSDHNGIYNRYLAKYDSTIAYIDTTTHYRYFTTSYPITNYSRSIISHDVNQEAFKYTEVVFKDQKYYMYVDELLPPSSITETQVVNTAYAEKKLKLIGADETKEGVFKNVLKGRKKRFSNVYYQDENPQTDESEIDINNYNFDQQTFIKPQGFEPQIEPDLSENQDLTPKFVLPKRRNYDVQFSMNELVSQIDFTYLNYTYQVFAGGGAPIFQTPGFNAFFKVGVLDLLEDYRITGGVRLSVDLSNSEFLVSFANLKKRLDKEIVFHRKVFEEYGVYSIIKHIALEVNYILRYPFSPVFSVMGSATLRNDKGVYLSTDQVNLREPNDNKNWAVLKGDVTYDDTRNVAANIYYGTRFKIFAEYYKLISSVNEDIIVVGMDFRHYMKLSRTLIWANRFAASTSFGTGKLIYYMGGVDNWISPKFNTGTPIDYTQNYIYQTLATNLRGFDQNIRNGNSFAAINSELRFPIFRYFANRPLKSDFLNSFQIVGFGDIGTAWTGLNPYSTENSLFTQTIERPPLNITVIMQKEPIVGGFGCGLRTRVFGYFLRADLAWGVEDGVVLPAKFYFSLSLDF